MSEDSSSETAAERLAEAVKELVAEKFQEAGIGGLSTPPPSQPRLVDVLFLLLLLVNLSVLIYLIPVHFLEGPHWELLGKAIPIAGGTCLAVVAAWYKNQSLKLISDRRFQILQIIVSGSLLLLWVPWVPIHPLVEPSEATVVRDSDGDHPWHSDKRRKIMWVSFGPHSFEVSKMENGVPNTRTFALSLVDVIEAAWGGEERHWSLCYEVTFDSDMKGYSIHIEPVSRKRLDDDFINHAYTHSLQEGPGNNMVLTLGSGIDHGTTKLPFGIYRITVYTKEGCAQQPPQELRVGPDDPNPRTVEIAIFQCNTKHS
jgi:hypothetical protein